MNINPFANVSLQDYLEIVQIVDSTFPIGSFNHSFGMENYLREDTVTDDKGYEEWQEAYLDSQFKYGEGLVIKLVYDAMATDDLELKFGNMIRLLTVSTQARETRQGTKMIAKQMLRLIQRLHAIPVLDDYQSKIRKGEVYGNPAIVFALYVFNKGLGMQ
ncbi:MAG: urease accessory protein UreF [Streptococcus salivarius]